MRRYVLRGYEKLYSALRIGLMLNLRLPIVLSRHFYKRYIKKYEPEPIYGIALVGMRTSNRRKVR